MIDLDLQVAVGAAVQAACGVPDEARLRAWVAAALAGREDAELTVRVVDEAEIAALNATYRGKEGPTNVLSFPADLPPEVASPLLGDVVICAPVVAAQAEAQGKALEAHWAHMVVHGCLHLLGYDHIEAAEAEAMEGREREVLAHLGFPDPYADGGVV